MLQRKYQFVVAGCLALMLGLIGCGQQDQADSGNGNGPGTDGTLPSESPEVTLAYVEWASEVASTHVLKAVLERELNADVTMRAVSAAIMWQAVASGDADATVAAWLPSTHGHYLEEVADQVDNLGPNLEGTKIGLVVPAYVEIDSIDQINDHADQFDGKIIGIDPGAGIMSKTEQAIDTYGMDNMRLVSSSGAAMTATLGEAIRNNDWAVVTGWTPHWKFARWELKYLQDPQGIYGGKEHISTIARQGLKQDMPKVYAILDAFSWTPEDMQQVMMWNQEEGADPDQTARRWIDANPDKVKAWLPAAGQ